MAITWIEHNTSSGMQRAEDGRWIVERVIKFYDSNNATITPEDVYNGGFVPVHLAVHPRFTNAYLRDVRLQQEEQFVIARLTYGQPDYRLAHYTNEEVWEWDVGSQQEHITSVPNASYVAHYPSADDLGLAIGQHEDDVQGVDVYRPVGTLQVSRMWSAFSSTQRRTLMGLRSMTNDANWFEFYAGEVLFLGGQIQPQPDGRTRVNYQFLISDWRSAYSVTLYDGTTVSISPYPWDYVWYEYGKDTITGDSEQKIASTIKSVHIAQVYDEGNFASLGLLGP